MKVWVFEGVETDWVAASSEAEARETLRRHYGISEEDIAGSYDDIYEAASDLIFETDEVDAETEEPITTTAAEIIEGKTHPFVVGSTFI